MADADVLGGGSRRARGSRSRAPRPASSSAAQLASPALFSPFGLGALGTMSSFAALDSLMDGMEDGMVSSSSFVAHGGHGGRPSVKRTSTSTKYINGKKITTRR